MDAAVSKTRNCGAAAAVCRSNNGNFMGSSALVIHGITDAATLEAIACREGFALAQDLLLTDFVIVSDSKQVVNDIKSASNGGYRAIISEIRNLLVGFDCNITFEGRASNSDVDRLVKFAHSLDRGRHLWFLEPHDPFCIPLNVVFEQLKLG